MSAALDAILSDTESQLEIAVEIDSAKRSDGTLKTWFISTHLRSTDSTEVPVDTEFMPFLVLGGVLGPLSQSLSEDLLFSGLAANNPGTITLIQQNLDNDQLSELYDYVFAGYEARIKIGRVTDTYESFVPFRSTTVQVDPSVDLTQNGLQATFQLSGAISRLLDESLITKRHVGVPTCAEVLTTTPVATAAYNAAHDLKTFTIMYRVMLPSLPAAARNLIAKTSGSTNNNFVINILATGWVECQASLAGAASMLHASGFSIADSEWHTIVWGLLDQTTSYLMIDNRVINVFTPTASVDLPAVGVRMARFLLGKHSTAAVFNRYISPDEAVGISSVRITGTELGCVGCWRFDDGGSATSVNDYSSTNADATWTGVLNTDYRWTYTDLGEPELAGTNYPLLVGNVINAPAQLIDSSRERYRGNVDESHWYQASINKVLTVRSQGTVLTGGGVDYTAPSDGGDGVFSMTAQESEPVTFDLLNNGTGEQSYYPSSIAYLLLTGRTRILGSQLKNIDPLTVLCPWPSGYWTDQETTAQQAIKEILGESAIHYYEDENGKLFFNFLLPPMGYGPYNEPCLDLRGGQGNYVVWGDIADISSSMTITCWFKTSAIDQTGYNWGASEPNQGSQMIINKGGISGNYALWFQTIGADAGKLKFRIAGSTLSTVSGVIKDSTWYFIGAVFNDSTNLMSLFIHEHGAALPTNWKAILSNTSSPSVNSQNLTIGDNGARFPWFATQHVAIWNTAKSLVDLQNFVTTQPVGNESGLLFYAPITEGAGNPVDKVSLTSGVVTTADPLDPNGQIAQWAPKLVINLDDTPSVKLSNLHHTHPAWNIVVKYAKNNYPMDDSDIDSGVSQNDRLRLTSEGKNVKFESLSIRDRYKNAKKVVLDSPITDSESAQRLLRAVEGRFGTGNYVGELSFPPGLNISRLSCGLQLGDEVGLVGTIPSQIQTPMSFRVVSVAPNPLKLSNNIVIWK